MDDTDSSLDIHFVKSRGQLEYGLCFVRKGTRNVVLVVSYTTRDARGPVSCLIPSLTEMLPSSDNFIIKWHKTGTVKLETQLTNIWTDSTYITTITHRQLTLYKNWLTNWERNNRNYTIFEGGRTIRSFIQESLMFFSERSDLKYLCTPEIRTYILEYTDKERIGIPDLRDAIQWYRILSGLELQSAINAINQYNCMYYHEYINGDDRYWLIAGVKIVPLDQVVELNCEEVNDDSLSFVEMIEKQVVKRDEPFVQQPLIRSHCEMSDPITSPVAPVNCDNTAIVVIITIIIIVLILIFIFVLYRRSVVLVPAVNPSVAPIPVYIDPGRV